MSEGRAVRASWLRDAGGAAREAKPSSDAGAGCCVCGRVGCAGGAGRWWRARDVKGGPDGRDPIVGEIERKES
jgi:hypothetical protein